MEAHECKGEPCCVGLRLRLEAYAVLTPRSLGAKAGVVSPLANRLLAVAMRRHLKPLPYGASEWWLHAENNSLGWGCSYAQKELGWQRTQPKPPPSTALAPCPAHPSSQHPNAWPRASDQLWLQTEATNSCILVPQGIHPPALADRHSAGATCMGQAGSGFMSHFTHQKATGSCSQLASPRRQAGKQILILIGGAVAAASCTCWLASPGSIHPAPVRDTGPKTTHPPRPNPLCMGTRMRTTMSKATVTTAV